MGFIKVKFGVFNPLSPTKTTEVEGIVDPGTMYSVIPRRGVEGLGVKLIERRRFRVFERDISEDGMEIMGRRRTVTVIMGRMGIRSY